MTWALRVSCEAQEMGFPHTVKQSATCQSNAADDGEDWQAPVDTSPFCFNDTPEEQARLSGILIRQAAKSITLSPRITTAGKTGTVATYLNLLICLKLTEQDLSKRLTGTVSLSLRGFPSFGLSSLLKKSCAPIVTSNHPFVSPSNDSHLHSTVTKWG